MTNDAPAAPESTLTVLRPSQLTTALCGLVPLGQTTFIWGPPGVGKSAIVAQVAAATGRKLVVKSFASADRTDVGGFPWPDAAAGVMRYLAPDLPTHDPDQPSILFMDELNHAPTSVQAALLPLIGPPYRLNEYSIPPNCTVIAAGNREGDRAGVQRLITPMMRRFLHLYAHTDIDDWCVWAAAQGIATEIIFFLRFKSNMLYKFDPARIASEPAFPSPPAWDELSRVLLTAPPAEIELALYAGRVGQAAAIEFTAFMRIWRQLPTVDSVVADPRRAPVPDTLDAQYAIAGSLAGKASAANFDAIVAYLHRLPADIAYRTILDAEQRCPEVKYTKGYIDWCAANAKLLAA